MRFPIQIAALSAVCACALFPVHAQDDAGAPPPPSNGPYAPPSDQGPSPGQAGAVPDAQAAPDPNSSADQPASFQTFYDNLASQGTWIQSSDYGYVWQPTVSDPDWAPYTEGRWVYSDAGWTWASDEPFGWATYHYGRWVNLDGTGWCWVPGYTWAPAWVSWRYGGGYCGWAPLPPDSFVGIDYAGDGMEITADFHIGGDCDSYYGIGAGWYHFLPVNYLGYANYRDHYAHRSNNYAIINGTTNVTNLYVNRNAANGSGPGRFNAVTMGGPSLDQVNAISETPIQRVALQTARQPGAGERLTNNSLALYAPRIAAGPTAHPLRVAGSLGRAAVNRGVDVAQPLVVNRNLGASAFTSAEIQQARTAQTNAPHGAKIATADTQINPALQSPLTAMQPMAASSSVHVPTTYSNTQHTVFSPTPAASGQVSHSFNSGNYNASATANPQGNPYAQQTYPNGNSNGTFYHSQTQGVYSQPQFSPVPSYNPNPSGNSYPGGAYHPTPTSNSISPFGSHSANTGNNQQQQSH